MFHFEDCNNLKEIVAKFLAKIFKQAVQNFRVIGPLM